MHRMENIIFRRDVREANCFVAAHRDEKPSPRVGVRYDTDSIYFTPARSAARSAQVRVRGVVDTEAQISSSSCETIIELLEST